MFMVDNELRRTSEKWSIVLTILFNIEASGDSLYEWVPSFSMPHYRNELAKELGTMWTILLDSIF